MQEPLNQEEIDSTKTQLEKQMMHINSKSTDKERRMYLAGYLNCLLEKGDVLETTYEEIYPQYCF